MISWYDSIAINLQNEPNHIQKVYYLSCYLKFKKIFQFALVHCVKLTFDIEFNSIELR